MLRQGPISIALYISQTSRQLLLRTLSTALIIILVIDLFRLRSTTIGKGRFASLYESIVGTLMRESERKQLNSTIWYLLGAIISIASFERDIAICSVCILAFGDTSASTFGRLLGSKTPKLPSPPFGKKKSLAGSIAAFITGVLVTYLIWGISFTRDGLTLAELGKLNNDSLSYNGSFSLIVFSLGVGFITAFVEGLDLNGLDDNLTLPALSGLLITLLLKLF